MECTLIVTTGGGLYRYRIADVLRVTDRIGTTPCFAFVAKSESISGPFGEKLHEAFCCRLFSRSARRIRVESGFALLAPEKDWRELWLCAVHPDEGAVADFRRERFGVSPLCECHVHYAPGRRLGQLKPVRVVRVGDGAYRAVMLD